MALEDSFGFIVREQMMDAFACASNAASGELRTWSGSSFTILNCCWQNCTESFEGYKSLQDHFMNLHLNPLMSVIGDSDDENASFKCSIVGCTFRTLNPDYLRRHLLFHLYHARSILLGATALACASEVESRCCTYSSIGANNVLYDGQPLHCFWDRCYCVLDDVCDYFQHVSYHARSLDCERDVKEGKFVCSWEKCENVTTRSRWLMERHLMHHSGEKQVACPVCGVFFATNICLKDHIIRQFPPSENKAYRCKLCRKVFGSERLLREHCRHHINRHKCPYCEMTCEAPSHLRHHITHRHSNLKDFPCYHCTMQFKNALDLRRHISAVHFPQKGSFKCEACSRAYSSKQALQTHTKQHETDNPLPYACHLCESRYCRGGFLTKHLTRRHGLKKPSGHSRFIYRKCEDGSYRLVTERFESHALNQSLRQLRNGSEPTNSDTSEFINGEPEVLCTPCDMADLTEKLQNGEFLVEHDVENDAYVLKFETTASC